MGTETQSGIKLHDEAGAAGLLGCSRALLQKLRREKKGPRWTRVGRLIRYPEPWIMEFLERNACDGSQSHAIKVAKIEHPRTIDKRLEP